MRSVVPSISNLVITTKNNLIFNLKTDKLDQKSDPIPFGNKIRLEEILHVFHNPSGNHFIYCCKANGVIKNFYLNRASIKLKEIDSLKKIEITCAAWNKEATVKSTKEMLVRDKNGDIHEVKIDFDDNSGKIKDSASKVYSMTDEIQDIIVAK